tara:strand:- start:372 stop:1442 length:1071 start_codon:yes stop_codon:yes gene_type:complete
MRIIYLSNFIVFLFLISKSYALILEKTPVNLDSPWGMTWLTPKELLITQKTGEIFLVNIDDFTQVKIKHSIPSVLYGQGGLLDINSEGNIIWVTCSVEKNRKYTTAVFQSEFNGNELINTKMIYEALPYIDSPYHFGSRIEIVNDSIYVSIGERGQGMIAQDTSNSIGSIIRLHKNGGIPKDNPFINNDKWLPELFQIGVRNPQGMTYDNSTNSIFISNHGPKGGDFVGPVISGTNYGWKKIGWGGTNYSGTKIGEGNAWEPGFLKPDFIWVPSIGIGGIKFYQGDAFPEWENSLLVGSLKFKYLSVLRRNDSKFAIEEIIFKDEIGRVRDIEIDSTGQVYLIADEVNSNLFILRP